MDNADTIQIRVLEENDPPSIAAAFTNMGWDKPEAQYRRYLREQVEGTRTCFVAIFDGQFAGYVTVNWRPVYAGFADPNIPEIQDLNVLTSYRRKGIAGRLLDRAEGEAARRSGAIGIAVGLHPGYNAAQRLYAQRGYIPACLWLWRSASRVTISRSHSVRLLGAMALAAGDRPLDADY
jgi:GNAT superfamily N-acetyltransferase